MNQRATPADIVPYINKDQAAGKVCAYMCEHHKLAPIPKPVLMLAAGLSENVQGKLLAHSGLYNAIIKANDGLAARGWRIEAVDACTPQESFKLIRVKS